jgi:hypothetical protein
MDRIHQQRAVTDNAFQEGKITPYQRPRWEAMIEASRLDPRAAARRSARTPATA